MKPCHTLARAFLLPCLASALSHRQTRDAGNGAGAANTPAKADGFIIQKDAPGHLVRLSHNNVDHATTYEYDQSAGQGITVYVLDNGIQRSHKEFQGRATSGMNSTRDSSNWENHGTHVAGIIGGVTYGVAKKVKLVDVRTGTSASEVIHALEFVLEDVKKKNITGRAVVSMSSHVAASDPVDRKFEEAVASGIVCVVSAGNNNDDAGHYSPARGSGAITVAAMDHRTGHRWENSNYGPAVDLYAPGVDVQSANPYNEDATSLSGTSQAAPVVAGLAAYIMALEGITEPRQVASRLKELAKQSGARVMSNAPNTTDLVASMGNDQTPVREKKLPWASQPPLSIYVNNCGRPLYSEWTCGTHILCNSFDGPAGTLRVGFFQSAQDCFDAHEPRPKLPWIPAPHIPADCAQRYDCRPCNDEENYSLRNCGTQAYCEAADRLGTGPWPYRGFRTSAECFDAHGPPPPAS